MYLFPRGGNVTQWLKTGNYSIAISDLMYHTAFAWLSLQRLFFPLSFVALRQLRGGNRKHLRPIVRFCLSLIYISCACGRRLWRRLKFPQQYTQSLERSGDGWQPSKQSQRNNLRLNSIAYHAVELFSCMSMIRVRMQKWGQKSINSIHPFRVSPNCSSIRFL